jgi:hypothetical protein
MSTSMNTSNVVVPAGVRWNMGSVTTQESTSNVPKNVEEQFSSERTSGSSVALTEAEDSVAVLHRVRYGE